VRVDAFAIKLRRRGNMEAADLGVRLCQSVARQVYACYLAAALPVAAVALACFEFATWMPILLIWWLKPWLDRTILFVLSRAVFAHRTTVGDLWRAQRHVWWSQLLSTITIRRLSPWRSFTQPVWQLEGLSLGELGRRLRQIRTGKAGAGFLITQAFSLIELALQLSVVSLVFWFAPSGMEPDLARIFTNEGARSMELAGAIGYSLVVLALEPFYVAAGFGLYLNRRVELEAWDIEQELRRAFAR
jgi:hypothetical protein